MSDSLKLNLNTDKKTASTHLINARAMLIALACYRTEAWKAVAVCTLSCWSLTEKTHRLTLFFLHVGMAWAAPPWHAIVFEAAHRLTNDLVIRKGTIFIVISCSGIAFLSFVGGELLPAILAAIGAAIAMSTYLESAATARKKHATKFAGVLACIAWAFADFAELKDNLAQWLPVAGAIVLLSEF